MFRPLLLHMDVRESEQPSCGYCTLGSQQGAGLRQLGFLTVLSGQCFRLIAFPEREGGAVFSEAFVELGFEQEEDWEAGALCVGK